MYIKSHNKRKRWISDNMRKRIYCRDKYTCAYCLMDLQIVIKTEPYKIGLDHVFPDNDHCSGNLVVACYKCNSLKGQSHYIDFIKSLYSCEPNYAKMVINRLHTQIALPV